MQAVDLCYHCRMRRNQKGQFVRGTNGNTFEGFGVWVSHKGYPFIYVDRKNIPIHVLVWERENGPKPPGTEIHHIDENKENYELSNLELLTNSDHQKVHAGWIREEGEWIAKPCTKCKKVLPLSEFYPRKGFTPSALCKRCSIQATTERNNRDPERLKEYKRQWYLRRRAMSGIVDVEEVVILPLPDIEDDIRRCLYCHKPIVQRMKSSGEIECMAVVKQRKYCSHRCSSLDRRGKPKSMNRK